MDTRTDQATPHAETVSTRPVVRYEDERIELTDGESVLDGLLRHGIETPHSCKSGLCQSCLMRAEDGEPPAKSQQGLKDGLRAQNYFLSCVCHPEEDLTVVPPDSAGLEVAAEVAGVDRLTEDVVRLRLRPEGAFEYEPGQFLHLIRGDGLVRSYSIASLPEEEDTLELHVRQIPGGQMSNWIADGLTAGEHVSVRGPAGDCFYIPGNPEQDMLLAGTGTGLAPLYGIAREALRQGHTGRIILMHGGLDASRLYHVEALQELAREHENLTYLRCVLHGEPGEGVEVGPLDEVVMRLFPDLKGWRAFLCGDPGLVNKLRKKVFLAGASNKAIHADAFVTAGG